MRPSLSIRAAALGAAILATALLVRRLLRNARGALLFDAGPRTELRRKKRDEPTFSYYNVSARPAVVALRGVLNDWFRHFPSSARADLRSRFRSPIEGQHQGAFFELYIHELLRRMGLRLEVHPGTGASSKRPDFLVSGKYISDFFLEATLAGLPSQAERGADARISTLYEAIETIDSPNFFLEIGLRGVPRTNPPTRELRRRLTDWLGTLDPDEVAQLIGQGRHEEIPRHEHSHDGATWTFRPIPKSPESRGVRGIRPIGIEFGEGSWLNTHGEIRRAIESKATKYGDLQVPFVVAVNVLSEHCDEIDIMNALYGEETFIAREGTNGTWSTQQGPRRPNGVWYGPNGPRNCQISGVLIVPQLGPWSMPDRTPELFVNPWASCPLLADAISLPRCIADLTAGRVRHDHGAKASNLLGIPSPWPIPD